MRRGDVVIVSAKGDYGKPRPAIVIQNDRLNDLLESVTVCFLTSDLTNSRNLRVSIEPEPANGLREPSQVQIEKIMTFPKDKVRGPVGRLNGEQLRAVDRGLLIFFDLLPPFELLRVP